MIIAYVPRETQDFASLLLGQRRGMAEGGVCTMCPDVIPVS